MHKAIKEIKQLLKLYNENATWVNYNAKTTVVKTWFTKEVRNDLVHINNEVAKIAAKYNIKDYKIATRNGGSSIWDAGSYRVIINEVLR